MKLTAPAVLVSMALVCLVSLGQVASVFGQDVLTDVIAFDRLNALTSPDSTGGHRRLIVGLGKL